jgi:hypothetical protein
MHQHQEILKLYLAEQAKAKKCEALLAQSDARCKLLEASNQEEVDKSTCEHRKYVHCLDLIQDKEMQI